jgi:RNA polymerase sigma-70 factor, ECF subfamily
MSQDIRQAEQNIRGALMAGNVENAVCLTLEAYSREILSFLVARLGSVSAAQDVFSMFAEDLWIGLPAFAWRCTTRTWCYTLARNAAYRYSTAGHRQPERNLALSSPSAYSALVEQVRSATNLYQRTDVKNRFRALRERLDPEDQTLLILRVDRGLTWRELALAMTGDSALDAVALEREVARLRKAFERIKSELKRWATKEGLLKRDE